MPQPIALRADRWLGISLIAAYGTAAISLGVILGGPYGWIAAGLVAALGVVVARNRAWHRASRSVRALTLSGPDSVLLELRNGEQSEWPVAPRRHVGAFWVLLPHESRPAAALLLTSGMFEPHAFRQIRLWALWSRTPPIREHHGSGPAGAGAN